MDIQSAKQVIRAAALADDTVIMEGLHGIGKSNIVKQFAKEDGYHLEELFLSHQEVGDLIGIPHTIEIDGSTVTTWSKPIWFQRIQKAAAEGKQAVLFLDELNRAPIDVRQSALQLVLERMIHEHELPTVDGQRTLVVAAINPADEYQVDELDPALLDRFLHIEVEADAPAFIKWGRSNNVNSMVLDFITEYPDRLHWMPQDGGIGATPRSWAKLGDFMDNVNSIPEEILFQVMKGKVGVELGSQFYSFFKNYADVVKMEDIEAIVSEHMDTTETVEELAEFVKVRTSKMEAIQKTELANQLANKYKDEKEMLPFLAYLYAMEIEIVVAFLKSFRKDDPEAYKNLAKFDTVINNKELFKRIVAAADKE
jgi:alkaline phosphatase D